MLSPFKKSLGEKGLLSCDAELPPGEEPYSEHPMWQTAARGLSYGLACKSRAKRKRHIHLGEVKSFLDAELSAGLSSAFGTRVPIIADSQVSLGAVTKGRSASPGINRLLRASLGPLLGLGVYSSGAYARSADNPADDPTRGQIIRGATIELPKWWCLACEGDYSEMDFFLEQEVPELREVPWSRELDDILLSFPKDLFICGAEISWPPCTPGFLDLYSGKKGFARKAVKFGADWVLTIDIEDGGAM